MKEKIVNPTAVEALSEQIANISTRTTISCTLSSSLAETGNAVACQKIGQIICIGGRIKVGTSDISTYSAILSMPYEISRAYSAPECPIVSTDGTSITGLYLQQNQTTGNYEIRTRGRLLADKTYVFNMSYVAYSM